MSRTERTEFVGSPREHSLNLQPTLFTQRLFRGALNPYLTIQSGRGHELCSLGTDELLTRASKFANLLKRNGVNPGSRVLFLLPTSRELVTGILATWMCRAVVVIAPYRLPSNSHAERQLSALNTLVKCASPEVIVGDPPFNVSTTVLTRDSLGRIDQSRESSVEFPVADDLAFIQFTSGSTGQAKGVCITHGQLEANLRGLVERIGAEVLSRVVSWLPLYHDMGYIGGLLLPLSVGGDCHLLTTESFSQSPGSWMRRIAETRSFFSPGPTFAFDLVALGGRRLLDLDLSSLVYGSIGAEMVSERVLSAFENALAPMRLSPLALRPCYGLAEATLAVSAGAPRRPRLLFQTPAKVHEIGTQLESHCRGPILVGNGPPLDNVEVRITGDGGKILPPTVVGRIEVRGDSVSSGYFGEKKRQEHEWLDTGDLGFIYQGEIFVSGRSKDILIRGGVNFSPEEIESAALQVRQVRPGRLAAISVLDHQKCRERLVLVLETSAARRERREELRQEVLAMVASYSGVSLDEVCLVSSGSLPKTTSGKLQRSVVRRLYQDGELF